MKYFNIGTKIFLLTIRRQLSEFLTVFKTDFAYLYFYRNCAKSRGHKETLLKTSFINCRHFKVSVSFLLYWSIHLIQRTQIEVYTHTFKNAKRFTLSAIQQHWFDLWTTKKTLPSGTETSLHFSIVHVVSWSIESNTRTAMGLITNGCRLRSPAIKDVTHNNPHGSFLFNFFFFASTYENWSDNKQHNVLTMDVRVTLQLCTSLNKAGIQNIHEHFHFSPLTCCQLKVHQKAFLSFPIRQQISSIPTPAAPPAQLAVARSVGPEEED